MNPRWPVRVGLLATAPLACGLLYAGICSAGPAESVQDKPAAVEMQPLKAVFADGAVPGKAVMARRALPVTPVAVPGAVLAKAVMAAVSPGKAVMSGATN